jgi:hypothetical protein
LAFKHGLVAASAPISLALVWLYSVAAYTRDIRARIPFLMEAFGIAGVVQLWIILVAIGLGGLVLAGGWSWRSLTGAPVAALVGVFILDSGVVGRAIPVSYENPPQYWALVLAVLALCAILIMLRRRVAKWAQDARRAA